MERGRSGTLTRWVAADLESAYESSLPGARLPVATLRPVSAGGLGPRCSAEPALASGGQRCGAKLWGKRWMFLGGPEGLGVGGEEAGLGRGRGDTSQSWTLGGRAISPSPWTGRCLGSRSLEQVGLAPGQDASPSSTVRDPPSAALRLQIKLAHGFPTRGAQMSPLTGRRCHFVSFWQWGGPPEFRAARPHCRGPGARSPPPWAP